jgi:hypothetical protein
MDSLLSNPCYSTTIVVSAADRASWFTLTTPAREWDSGTKCGLYARQIWKQPACSVLRKSTIPPAQPGRSAQPSRPTCTADLVSQVGLNYIIYWKWHEMTVLDRSSSSTDCQTMMMIEPTSTACGDDRMILQINFQQKRRMTRAQFTIVSPSMIVICTVSFSICSTLHFWYGLVTV